MSVPIKLISPNEILLPQQYSSLLLSFYEIVQHSFGPDLSFFMICGSAGRGHFIDGWSDIDVLIICDNYNSRKMEFIPNFLQKSDIKIGSTIYSSHEIRNLSADAKTFYSLYLWQLDKLRPFIHRDSLLIPQIQKSDLLAKLNSFTPEVVHKLKRILYRPTQMDAANIVKSLYLIIKNRLLIDDIMPSSYEEAFETFSKKYGLYLPAVPPKIVCFAEITAYAHSVLDIITANPK